jgi:hypothetical protein
MLLILETLIICAAIVLALDALVAIYVNGADLRDARKPILLGVALCVLAAVFLFFTLRELIGLRAKIYYHHVLLTLVACAGMLIMGIGFIKPSTRERWATRLASFGPFDAASERAGLLVVLLLSSSLAVMYQNATQAYQLSGEIVSYYIGIFKGRPDAVFEEASRLVLPSLMAVVKIVFRDTEWTLVIVAFLVTAFSLLMFYLLCLRLVGNPLRAIAGAVFMALLVPIYIGPKWPLSAPLIFGLYCGMCWAVLAGNRTWLVLIAILAVFQRPELVVCAAFFQILHEKLYLNWRRVMLPLVLTSVAIVVPLMIKEWMGAGETVYFEKVSRWSCGIVSCPEEGQFNVLYLKKDVLLFLPIIAGLVWSGRLDRTCRYMLIALIPYTVLFLLVGDLTEPRLFFPIAAVAIANIVKTARFLPFETAVVHGRR